MKLNPAKLSSVSPDTTPARFGARNPYRLSEVSKKCIFLTESAEGNPNCGSHFNQRPEGRVDMSTWRIHRAKGHQVLVER